MPRITAKQLQRLANAAFSCNDKALLGVAKGVESRVKRVNSASSAAAGAKGKPALFGNLTKRICSYGCVAFVAVDYSAENAQNRVGMCLYG